MLKIKEIRKAKKITAKQLAVQVNVAESTMSLYENGKREPDYNTLVKIADVLEVSTDYLLGIDTEKEKPTANDGELSDNRKKLMEFASSVPEDKVDLLLRVMQSIVEDTQ